MTLLQAALGRAAWPSQYQYRESLSKRPMPCLDSGAQSLPLARRTKLLTDYGVNGQQGMIGIYTSLRSTADELRLAGRPVFYGYVFGSRFILLKSSQNHGQK